MSTTPVVKNVAKGKREEDGYETFVDWIDDVQNNVYIGPNAARYCQRSMPESKWVMPMAVYDYVGAQQKEWMMKGLLDIYEKYVRHNAYLMNSLPELKGKKLGCWCHPNPCHGDVLVKLYQENFEKPQVLGEKKKKNG